MAEINTKKLTRGEIWWVDHDTSEDDPKPPSPEAVVESLRDRVSIKTETATSAGLRAPQVGALYALLSQATLADDQPVTIVLPTGTGKTETMLADFCYRPRRTLVVVPSNSLRTQIAQKFATLGILPEAGIVSDGAMTPAVAVLKHRFKTVDEVRELVDRCNVLVTTAAALGGLAPEVLTAVTERFEQLFVDEAHHVVARTWAATAEAFAGRRIVQFTATPFREDGKHLPGRIAYAFSLRQAQADGYSPQSTTSPSPASLGRTLSWPTRLLRSFETTCLLVATTS